MTTRYVVRPKFGSDGTSIRHVASRCWKALADFPRLYLGLALTVETLAILALSHRVEMMEPLIQFLLGAREIVATRHIVSTFLPIGYSALLGWAMVLGASHGAHGVQAAILALHTSFALLVVVFSRNILLQSMPVRTATTIALAIGLNPRVIANVFSETDTNLSLVLLLAILACVLQLRRSDTLKYAVLAGVVLGCGVLVRPNLALMAGLPLWAVWCRPVGRMALVLLQTAAACLLIYFGTTAVVHGRPFYPQNGPYNLYAGYNAYTETALRKYWNAEDSILPALASSGIHSELDWHRQPDLPGVDDCRNQSYEAFYSSSAKSYIYENPKQVVRLSALKLWTLFRVGGIRNGPSGRSRSLMGLMKTGSFLIAVPFWLGLLFYSRLRSLSLGSEPVLWMAVFYIVPFALTNADPRFRIALEGVVLTDTARMLYLLYHRKRIAAKGN